MKNAFCVLVGLVVLAIASVPMTGCVEPCEEVTTSLSECPELNPVADSCDSDCANCLMGRDATCDTVSGLIQMECSLRCE